jgi:hypothetical protein
VVPHQPDYLAHHLVEINHRHLKFPLFEQLPQALDDLSRPLIVRGDVGQAFTYLREIGRFTAKKSAGGLGIAENRRQGLVEARRASIASP